MLRATVSVLRPVERLGMQLLRKRVTAMPTLRFARPFAEVTEAPSETVAEEQPKQEEPVKEAVPPLAHHKFQHVIGESRALQCRRMPSFLSTQRKTSQSL